MTKVNVSAFSQHIFHASEKMRNTIIGYNSTDLNILQNNCTTLKSLTFYELNLNFQPKKYTKVHLKIKFRQQ